MVKNEIYYLLLFTLISVHYSSSKFIQDCAMGKTLKTRKTRKRLRIGETYSRQHPSPSDFATAATEMLQSIVDRQTVERVLARFYKKQQDAEIQKRRELFRRIQLKKNFNNFLACLGVSI